MANVLYVDGLAANGGVGTLVSPWNCLDQVTAYSTSPGFLPGDIVQFKRGTTIAVKTATALSIVNGGAEEEPITFQDYGVGPLPIIDCGGVAIPGVWTEPFTGIYYNAYSGSAVNGFTEDSMWLTHSAAIAGMDAGQWFWNSTSNVKFPYQSAYPVGLYYRPTSGAPASHILRKCSSTNGVGIGSNLSHLRFKNLHFKGGAVGVAIGTPSTTHIYGIEFIRCTFEELRTALDISGSGVWSTNRCKAKYCIVLNCGKGIHFGSRDTSAPAYDHDIIGNTVTNIDLDARFSSFGGALDREGIGLQNSVRCKIVGNTIQYGCLHGGLLTWIHGTLGKFDGNLFAANVVKDIDGSGIVLGAAVNAPSKGYNVVSGNIVARAGQYGIKVNTTSTLRPSLVTNNVIDACGLAHLFTQSTCAGWEIQNNISVNPVTHHASWGGASTCRPNANDYWPISGTQFAENGVARSWGSFQHEVYMNGVTVPLPDASSVSVDPQFTVGTYRLAPTSPLKTAGLYGSHAALDGDGVPFSIMPIGAY